MAKKNMRRQKAEKQEKKSDNNKNNQEVKIMQDDDSEIRRRKQNKGSKEDNAIFRDLNYICFSCGKKKVWLAKDQEEEEVQRYIETCCCKYCLYGEYCWIDVVEKGSDSFYIQRRISNKKRFGRIFSKKRCQKCEQCAY